MESEGSSPHSQAQVTCSCPEPDQPSPRLAIKLLENVFNIILLFSFPQVSLGFHRVQNHMET
jgi:hypothetical protein